MLRLRSGVRVLGPARTRGAYIPAPSIPAATYAKIKPMIKW